MAPRNPGDGHKSEKKPQASKPPERLGSDEMELDEVHRGALEFDDNEDVIDPDEMDPDDMEVTQRHYRVDDRERWDRGE